MLLIGRLVYEKGFQLALDALPRSSRASDGVRFLVAGSGTARGRAQGPGPALGLEGHGTFLGWIGDDVLHSLYRIADLCVVPSIYEPFGLVALEAMASGCPCIVADTGGLREVVPHGTSGCASAARDPRSLARMIERLLTDAALRDRLVTEATEHVLRSTGPTSPARPTSVYDALAARGEVRPATLGRYAVADSSALLRSANSIIEGRESPKRGRTRRRQACLACHDDIADVLTNGQATHPSGVAPGGREDDARRAVALS